MIRQHIPAWRLDAEKFPCLLLHSIYSNGEAPVNFSAIRTVQGEYVLTSVYDLRCPRIHLPHRSDSFLSNIEFYAPVQEVYCREEPSGLRNRITRSLSNSNTEENQYL